MKKRMLFVVVLAACFALALAACGCSSNSSKPPAGGQTSAVEAARDAAAPASSPDSDGGPSDALEVSDTPTSGQAASDAAAFGQAASGAAASDGAGGSAAGTAAGDAASSSGGSSASAASANVTLPASKYSYSDDEVDIDLTQMSSTAVYSTVSQMMTDPAPFQNKVVKMEGIFYSQYNEAIGERLYFVIVKDATACCAQGIEFVWDDDEHTYPDDYPPEDSEVVACGVFGHHAQRSSIFAYMDKASLEMA